MSGRCEGGDLCSKCEEVLQSYLDRELTELERVEAQAHLERCGYCARRYRFEEQLRRYVRECCEEPIPVELKARLRDLRTPL
jgi:mycothiol system anti-sigma-R factor